MQINPTLPASFFEPDPVRPSFYGLAADMPSAESLAGEEHAEWQAKRRTPVVHRFDDDGKYGVLVLPDRPWADSGLLAEYDSETNAETFIRGLPGKK